MFLIGKLAKWGWPVFNSFITEVLNGSSFNQLWGQESCVTHRIRKADEILRARWQICQTVCNIISPRWEFMIWTYPPSVDSFASSMKPTLIKRYTLHFVHNTVGTDPSKTHWFCHYMMIIFLCF